MNTNSAILVKKLVNLGELPLPSYATLGSAGLDLLAAIENDILISPMGRVLIPTGIAIALPQEYEAQIRPRSGLAIKNGLTVINSPGTIDSDYRGEILVPLINLSSEDFSVKRGMRIAQMIISKFEKINWNIVLELPEEARGDRGFGSTGI